MSTGNDKQVADPSQKGIADATAVRATAGPSQRRQSNPPGSGRVAPSDTEPIAVTLARVSKRFAGITALADACISVRRGELMTLLGPSGCGKTTLLYLIAGFLAPDAGSVEIEGERVNEVPTYRRQIGIVFQSYALFPHMTVADNIGYGLRMRRLPKPEIARHVEIGRASCRER